jgi:hypothetical protein
VATGTFIVFLRCLSSAIQWVLSLILAAAPMICLIWYFILIFVFAHPAGWGGDCGAGDFDGELSRIEAGYVATGSGRSSRVKRMD